MNVNPNRMSGLAVATLLVFCGAAAAVGASEDRPRPIDERLHGSAKAVVATAKSIDARWHKNSHGDRLIVSRILLQVEETLKGDSAEFVVMDLEGGTLDGNTLRVSDLPRLQPGERAVFFLDETGDAIHAPHLRGQGILKLDEKNLVRGTSLHLDEIRRVARDSKRQEKTK